MLPHAYVSHESPGRLRLRIPSLRYDENYFSKVQERLSAHAGVLRVETSPVTGSVLVLHQLGAQELLLASEGLGLFAAGALVPTERPAPWEVKTLVGLGLLQVARGQLLAPASSLLMDAYRLWRLPGGCRAFPPAPPGGIRTTPDY